MRFGTLGALLCRRASLFLNSAGAMHTHLQWVPVCIAQAQFKNEARQPAPHGPRCRSALGSHGLPHPYPIRTKNVPGGNFVL